MSHFSHRHAGDLPNDAPAFLSASQPSFAPPPPSTPPNARADDPQFDIFSWQPKYASCQRYFLDHAQHSGPVQAVAAFLNIHLPFQRTPAVINSAPTRASPLLPNPSISSSSSGGGVGGGVSTGGPAASTIPFQSGPSVSLVPYLRRLVVTGLDYPGVLHGFFGDDWAAGIGPLHEQERRNYLFAAKSGGWAGVKRDYDMPPYETVPFLRPLQSVVEPELVAAERTWSEWLALEDWMVGPRAPEGGRFNGGTGGGSGGGQGSGHGGR